MRKPLTTSRKTYNIYWYDIGNGSHSLNNFIKMKDIVYFMIIKAYYPSMMLKYGFFTRNSKNPNKYQEIYDTRVALKRAGKKKEQFPYKIVLNSTYGAFGSETSECYDPMFAHMICMTGQLGLIDLHEKLHKALGDDYEIIQSNTDGIICRFSKSNYQLMLDTCKEWEDRMQLGLDKDMITHYCGKDVNNYWFQFANGKEEVKGSYVCEKGPLSNDLPILNEAMVEFIRNGTKPEEYINNCDELIKFQKVFRLQGAYKKTTHNSEESENKTYRVFASKDGNDTAIYKNKLKDDGTYSMEKITNTSEHVKIINEDIRSLKCPDWLDKQWYIDFCWKRMGDFGFVKSVEDVFAEMFGF